MMRSSATLVDGGIWLPFTWRWPVDAGGALKSSYRGCRFECGLEVARSNDERRLPSRSRDSSWYRTEPSDVFARIRARTWSVKGQISSYKLAELLFAARINPGNHDISIIHLIHLIHIRPRHVHRRPEISEHLLIIRLRRHHGRQPQV